MFEVFDPKDGVALLLTPDPVTARELAEECGLDWAASGEGWPPARVNVARDDAGLPETLFRRLPGARPAGWKGARR